MTIDRTVMCFQFFGAGFTANMAISWYALGHTGRAVACLLLTALMLGHGLILKLLEPRPQDAREAS